MINFVNQDTSFFRIESPDIDSAFRILDKNVISFSITEEVRRFSTGTITIHDPDHIYSKILRIGANLNISWGFNQPLTLPRNIGDSAFGPSMRQNFKGVVENPSGRLSSNGSVIYNVNFFGKEYIGDKKSKIHKNTTRGGVIRTIMSDMGITNQIIDFHRANERLNENTHVIQRSTNYRQLIKLAYEWRAMFRLGYDSQGNTVGVFVDYDKIDQLGIYRLLSGAIGGSLIELDWKRGIRNVIEANWSQKAGLSGGGANVRTVIGPDGNVQFFRYVAQNQTVKVYRLVPERIGAEFRKRSNLVDRTRLLIDFASVDDFEEISKYFDEVDQSTAPQGYGYEISVKMFGNPLITAPARVSLGKGFPDLLAYRTESSGFSKFYCNQVTHTIDRKGYFCDLKVMDAFSAAGGTFVG